MKKFFVLAIFCAFVFCGAEIAYSDMIFTTTDYSTSALGVIDASGVGLKNTFTDGNVWLIPFKERNTDKLAVALRNAGTLEIYDQNSLSSPLSSQKIGANIQSGLFYENLFLLDKGDIFSGKGDAALYKFGADVEKLELQRADNEYKFFAEKILETGGALVVLLQRYKINPDWTIDHKPGELLKIDPATLAVQKRWELNKNPMDMVILNGEAYIISIGAAQGAGGGTPKLEIINIATESRREEDISQMDEPQKIAVGGNSLFIAESSVMDPVTYETNSRIFKDMQIFGTFPNGSITCLEYDNENSRLIALFSDYSTFMGSVKIYDDAGTLTRDYSSSELGGNAYQVVLASPSGGGGAAGDGEGGGCNAGFGFLPMLPVLLLFLFFPFFSHAAVVDVAEEKVTGSRIQEDADFSPGAVTIINAQELAGSVQDLPALLERVPGLHVTQLRGRGQYTVASVRGSSASQVAVYIDGQLANLGSEAAVNLALIPVENLERVEVYRGYIPARFGIAGLGGVINIVTKTQNEKNSHVSFGMGSFGEKRASLSWSGKLLSGDFFAGARYEGYEGDFSYQNDNATPTNINDDYTADRQNNGFNRGGLLLKFERDGFALRGEWQRNSQELPRSAPGNDMPGQSAGANMTTEQTNLQISKRFRAGAFDMGLSAAWLAQDKVFDDPNSTLGAGTWNEYKTKRWAFDYDAAVALGERHLLEFFANYTDENLTSSANAQDVSSRRTNLVLQDTIALDEAGSFLLSPLVRFNAESGGDNATTFNIALSKQFAENFLVRSNYGSYVRVPNLYERYGDGGILRATPDLKWERGEQFDIGFVWTGELLRGQTRGAITYFNRTSRDLIEFVMFGPYTAAYRNIGSASAQGFEFEAAWTNDDWSAEFAATLTESKNESEGYRNGMELPNTPKWTGFARVAKKFSSLDAFVEARYVSKNYLDYAQYIFYESVLTFGLGVKWKFSPAGTLHANVHDLFNAGDSSQFIHSLTEKHELAWYPAEGRSFNLSVTFDF